MSEFPMPTFDSPKLADTRKSEDEGINFAVEKNNVTKSSPRVAKARSRAGKLRSMVSVLSPHAVGFAELAEEAEKSEQQRAEKARRLREMLYGSSSEADQAATPSSSFSQSPDFRRSAPGRPTAASVRGLVRRGSPRAMGLPSEFDDLSSSPSTPRISFRRHSNESISSGRQESRRSSGERRSAEIIRLTPRTSRNNDSPPPGDDERKRAERARKLRALVKGASPKARGIGDSLEEVILVEVKERSFSRDRVREVVRSLSPSATGLLSESSEKEYSIEIMKKENNRVIVTRRRIGSLKVSSMDALTSPRNSISSSTADDASSLGANAKSRTSFSEL